MSGISSGLGFPSGVNVGALHFKIDEGLYYRYYEITRTTK